MSPAQPAPVYRFVGGGIMLRNNQIGSTVTNCIERALDLSEFYAREALACAHAGDLLGVKWCADRAGELIDAANQAARWLRAA
jgi:hypothetical protein